MTSTQYKKVIRSKLTLLNNEIDQKIACGLDYSDEARRHKMLRAQINKIQRRANMFSQFGSIIRFTSFF